MPKRVFVLHVVGGTRVFYLQTSAHQHQHLRRSRVDEKVLFCWLTNGMLSKLVNPAVAATAADVAECTHSA